MAGKARGSVALLAVLMILNASASVASAAGTNQAEATSQAEVASSSGVWGAWTQSPKYSKLEYRTKRKSRDSRSGKYHWAVEFRSSYEKSMDFAYDVTPNSTRTPDKSNGTRKWVHPGRTVSTSQLVDEAREVRVFVWSAKFL